MTDLIDRYLQAELEIWIINDRQTIRQNQERQREIERDNMCIFICKPYVGYAGMCVCARVHASTWRLLTLLRSMVGAVGGIACGGRPQLCGQRQATSQGAQKKGRQSTGSSNS